jgi:hypothetical protein
MAAWSSAVEEINKQLDLLTGKPVFQPPITVKTVRERFEGAMKIQAHLDAEVPFCSGHDNEPPPNELPSLLEGLLSLKKDRDSTVAALKDGAAARKKKERDAAKELQLAAIGEFSRAQVRGQGLLMMEDNNNNSDNYSPLVAEKKKEPKRRSSLAIDSATIADIVADRVEERKEMMKQQEDERKKMMKQQEDDRKADAEERRTFARQQQEMQVHMVDTLKGLTQFLVQAIGNNNNINNNNNNNNNNYRHKK